MAHDTPIDPNQTTGAVPAPDKSRRGQSDRRTPGQAMVEFALVAGVFFLIIFGTIDFGRAIFLYSELHNAVREAAREGKVSCGATGTMPSQATMQTRVRTAKNPDTNAQTARPGLTAATVSITTTGSCTAQGTLQVTGSVPFKAVTQGFLGISPFTLTASATVNIE